MLLLAHTGSHAQDRIDPRHPSVAYMQEWGTMDGATLTCLPGWVGETGELFGMQIIPTGDLNNDGLADYIIERTRCDTAFGTDKTTRGNELLLFYGRKNKLPTPADGLRIGPTEIGSMTTFLCTGDFDADGFFDIVCGIHLYNDTSQGPTGRYIGMPVVFWGQPNGGYSTSDTTQLPCDAPIWITPNRGVSGDFNGDQIADLLVRGTGSGFTRGGLVKIPRIYVFAGEPGKRWGRNGRDYSPVQRWWSPPGDKGIEYRDHDCSGENDLIFYDGSGNIFGNNIIDVHVVYQRSEIPWIDTTEIQSINVRSSGSEFALFSDVTGDHVLDLVTIGGDFAGERISVFAGKPGQRLL
ncbi:MAG: VCBS repeat-containing protein, partial [Armatimonadetes bacterium]|nr:VCBS repeat-containing protein [Armatimonadota bacterium]